MKGSFHPTTHLIKIFIFVIVLVGTLVPCPVRSAVAENDIKCLRGVKASLTQGGRDPEGKLSSWNFANTSVGFICQFVGVSCWKDEENRVHTLELRDMQLKGTVPTSLRYCGSLQNLDLSTNNLSGTIPAAICSWLPYVVTLDLSYNDLSGEIPPDLAKCAYLNKLILSNNHLSGTIPYQLSSLGRLKTFSVENNKLTGPIPPFLNSYDKAGFEGNDGLCGGPLGKCGKKRLAMIIAAGGLFAAGASLLLTFGVWWLYHLRRMRRIGNISQSVKT
ncbi:hypothetical protein SLA2020_428900 [Shorea laevis]